METPQGSVDRTTKTLDYNSVPQRYSPLATAAMILGLAGVGLSIIGVGVFAGLAAIVCGSLGKANITRQPLALTGRLRANIGITAGFVSVVLVSFMAFSPCMCGSRELSNRTYCQANLRSIMQSINVYASDNGNVYPALPYATHGLANGMPSAEAYVGASTAAVHSLFPPGAPLNGSPEANIWMLVLNDQVTPKQFVCKSDPYINSTSSTEKSPGELYLNFQKPDAFSYAFAYPYMADGNVGAWWKNTTDSSLPIISDMSAVNGTGAIHANVAPGKMPANPKIWNSPIHAFEGQGVAFADGHAEFSRRPDVGQKDDNIFSYTGAKSVSQFGGTQPDLSPINIQTDAAPFDIAMVPARNLNTGGLYR